MIKRNQVMRNRYLAGRVKRYHTWPVLHTETVAEHTFNVLRIYREIFGLVNAPVSYIMDHDLYELHTGDLPFPFKSRNPEINALMKRAESTAATVLGLPTNYDISDEQAKQVKICDLLQMWEFGVVELRMGNLFADAIVADTAAMVLSMLKDMPKDTNERVMAWMSSSTI